METTHLDPYAACERGRCNHDLARAVGIADLWGTDGPYAISHVIFGPLRQSPALFDDEERPYEPDPAAEQQRWAV
ncbi:MAG: hypothetical protein V1757_06350 [Actinomycetota bacterium]